MLVGADFIEDTLGGGHLEWEAIADARARLLGGHTAPALRHCPLAASLGQCCGGVVWLAFEVLQPRDLPAWRDAAARQAAGLAQTRILQGTGASVWSATAEAGALRLPSRPGAADWRLTQPLAPPAFTLNVYGAGHVGAALVQLLAPLALRLRWVDARAALLALPPPGVEAVICDDAAEAVAGAARYSSHLVLTHDHALDLALTEAILRRGDFTWFGLIGSQAKRARFRQLLGARGIAAEAFTRVRCPVGVEGIRDKTPQAIAIAIAAEVLQQRERLAHDATPPQAAHPG
ncbi:MAG: xanthine dehydrogenase accessory protein XdhC, partial [Candidatus Dactylopiibacterium sp.]|nr:xanthine dehydrogenase accessory protein XdhC [Candidatus Dactylopiibacterium sp.]